MTLIDKTHDPALRSWVASANGHAEFPIQNLPLGIFSPAGGDPRAGTAIGDEILDLRAAAPLLPDAVRGALTQSVLNPLLGLAAADRRTLRQRLSELLSDERYRAEVSPLLSPATDCVLHMPAQVGDYTDFYVGIHHAMNVGKQFRPDNPLLPNYKYVPIGYHGRASSLRPSGIAVTRPNGQRKMPDTDPPEFGPSGRLDYELELGVWIGKGNALGNAVPIAEAGDHIAGFCLLNDWSARDLQAWEYQPLGPFLAKNFHTTISPWIVTVDALTPFRLAQASRPQADPQPLPYLWDDADQAGGALAIDLEVLIATSAMRDAGERPFRLSRAPASSMYWTIAQIVAHHASNGCNLQPGDLLGTGTISAPTSDGFGSLLELTHGGTRPIAVSNEETRTFLVDGDELIMRGRAVADGYVSIGFGECRAVVLPAR